MSLILFGIGVSQGIIMGQAHLVGQTMPNINKLILKCEQIEQQVLRYKAALTIAKRQLTHIRNQLAYSLPSDIIEFIDTHILMLDDHAFKEGTVEIIHDELCNAEWALLEQKNRLVKVFNEINDPYLRTRKDDIEQVVNRILRILIKGPAHAEDFNDESQYESSIFICSDLSPTDLVLFKAHGGIALITEHGGPTSHSSILARSLAIPMLIGISRINCYIKEGDWIIVDGNLGCAIISPTPLIVQFYQEKIAAQEKIQRKLNRIIKLPTKTKNNITITLRANMELPIDMEAAQTVNADGIGLYRTEFLFMNQSSLPSEEEQFKTYAHIIKNLNPQTVTIRTLDTGGDKDFFNHASEETNPALGLRAIRLYSEYPEIFTQQMRAILRASVYGKVRILLPLISTIQEVDIILSEINQIKETLLAQRIPFDRTIKIGGMIEVPAAAVITDIFSQKLDFLSLGTNDLIQFTLAIDRENDTVNYLYDPAHPAILRLIQHVVETGRFYHIPVSMCGEMAGDPFYTRLLLGLGLTEFSAHPSNILRVKQIIKKTNLNKTLKEKALELTYETDYSKREAIFKALNTY